MQRIIYSPAHELAGAIRRRALSASDVVEAHLDRRWEDERLLAIAQAVVSVIGGFRAPPEPKP